MLLVFLAHFWVQFVNVQGGARARSLLMWFTHLATPSFVLLSGMMLGLLRYGKGPEFVRVRDKLIDRGLFLLIICHPLIAISYLPPARSVSEPFVRHVLVTDAVGVSLILGAPIAFIVRARTRVILGLLVLLTCWSFEVFWVPEPFALRLAKEILFGRLRGEWLAYNFPLLPWFGLYLSGSGLGELMAGWRATGQFERPHRTAFAICAVALGFVFLMKVVVFMFKPKHVPDPSTALGRFFHLMSLTEKIPPAIAYLIFYGGLALAGIGVALRVEVTDWRKGRKMGLSRRWLAMLGRNSLIAFVLQSFVYYTGVFLLPKPSLPWTLLYFPATVAVLLIAVRIADRHRLNAYFSVGYSGLRERWRNQHEVRGSTLAPRSADAHITE